MEFAEWEDLRNHVGSFHEYEEQMKEVSKVPAPGTHPAPMTRKMKMTQFTNQHVDIQGKLHQNNYPLVQQYKQMTDQTPCYIQFFLCLTMELIEHSRICPT